MNLDKYIIDDRIFSTKFFCDLDKCKGACCTLKGTVGAPVLKEETDKIYRILPKISKYLTKKNLDVIENEGIFIKGKKEYNLNTVDGDDCVFSIYEEGIAKCAIQKAYNEGEVDFRKPISCYLFPIRVSGEKRNVLRYEYMYECNDALDLGKEKNISIFEFARDAIINEYGEEFFNELKDKYIS